MVYKRSTNVVDICGYFFKELNIFNIFGAEMKFSILKENTDNLCKRRCWKAGILYLSCK